MGWVNWVSGQVDQYFSHGIIKKKCLRKQQVFSIWKVTQQIT